MSKSATKNSKEKKVRKPRKPTDGWAKLPWFKLVEKVIKDEAAIPQMTTEEFFEISRMLEDRHSIFYKFWEVGKPYFTRLSQSTAAVAFDRKTGNYVGFIFHPDFWKWLGEDVPDEYYSRLFVIAHEMLHIVLRHGLRAKDCDEKDLANKCLDIVVNHLLVDRFNFDRDKVKGANGLCWIDTLFAGNPLYTGPEVEPNKSFEYYYLLAKEYLPKGGGKGKGDGDGKGKGGSGEPQLVDDHEGLSPEDIDELLDEMNDILTDEEKEDLRDTLEEYCENDDGGPDHRDDDSDEGEGGGKGGKRAGCGSGGVWTFADTSKKVKRKRKWETVIKKWALHKATVTFRDSEQWARIHRRFAAVEDQLGDMTLPSAMEIEDRFMEQDRIEVWFYQDTSGSCVHLVERFFRAARSLPPDKFKIRLFAFNDRVYEANMETGKLNVGGGTNFAILEAEIQKRMQSEGIKYPEAIFVITDGYGTAINPAKPERWYWFLSEYYEQCIPKECHRFMLKDFE